MVYPSWSEKPGRTVATKSFSHFLVLLSSMLFLVLAPTASAQDMRVHFVDVEPGASTLLELPCAAVLIVRGRRFG